MCTAKLDVPAVLQVISGGQEVVLPSGVKYKDIKIGGGSKPTKGYLMVVDFRFVAIYAPLASQQRPKSEHDVIDTQSPSVISTQELLCLLFEHKLHL